MLKTDGVEAQYAHTLNKTIIPLRLEVGYKPDGWLGPLCLSVYHYDFSVKDTFDDAWEKLHERLTELMCPGLLFLRTQYTYYA